MEAGGRRAGASLLVLGANQQGQQQQQQQRGRAHQTMAEGARTAPLGASVIAKVSSATGSGRTFPQKTVLSNVGHQNPTPYENLYRLPTWASSRGATAAGTNRPSAAMTAANAAGSAIPPLPTAATAPPVSFGRESAIEFQMMEDASLGMLNLRPPLDASSGMLHHHAPAPMSYGVTDSLVSGSFGAAVTMTAAEADAEARGPLEHLQGSSSSSSRQRTAAPNTRNIVLDLS